MKVVRTVKRSLAVLLSALMLLTSVDLTALQVRAEGTAGNISVFTDKGLNAATVYYDWDGNPNPTTSPSIDGSQSIAGHNHINFIIVPGDGYELDPEGSVKVRVGSENGVDEDPDYADGVYSFELDDTEAYEIRIPLTGDGSQNDLGNGDEGNGNEGNGNEGNGGGNATNGTLTFHYQGDNYPSLGSVSYRIGDNGDFIPVDADGIGGSVSLSGATQGSKIYFTFSPEDGYEVDEHRHVNMWVGENSSQLSATNGVYSYTFADDPSTKPYQLEFGFESSNGNGNGGGNVPLAVDLELHTHKPENVSLPEASVNVGINDYHVDFRFDHHDVEQEDAGKPKDYDNDHETRTINYDGQDTVNLALSFGVGMRPTYAAIVDPDIEAPVAVLINDSVANQDLLQKVVTNGQNISYVFDYSNTPVKEIDGGGKALYLAVFQDAMVPDEMAVGSFWYENHITDTNYQAENHNKPRNYFIPDGFVEIESVTFEHVTFEDVTYDNVTYTSVPAKDEQDNPVEGTMSPDTGTDDDGQEVPIPDYMYWYSPVVGHGTAIIPDGAEMTVKVTPDFGYQLSKFSAREAILEPDEDNMCTYTFTAKGGLYALGVEFDGTENFIDSDSEFVRGGSVELAEGQEDLDCGTARVTVATEGINEDINDDGKNDFEAAMEAEGFLENVANQELYDYFNPEDEEFDLSRYTISDVFDVTLDEVVLQFGADEEKYWEKPVPTLADEAEISLELGARVKDAFIIHQEWNESEHDYTYEIVGLYNPNTKTVDFETDSFSNFALVTKGASTKVDSFELDSTTQTLYLSSNPDPYKKSDWVERRFNGFDENGDPIDLDDPDGKYLYDGWGTASTFFLTYTAIDENEKVEVADIYWTTSNSSLVDISPIYENGVAVGANVHAYKPTGKTPVTITATVVKDYDDKGNPIAAMGADGKPLTRTCKVTVAQGTIDVVQEDWQPVDPDHPEGPWEPSGDIIIMNSFGYLSEAQRWIQDAWENQYWDNFNEWTIDNPDGEEEYFHDLWTRTDPDDSNYAGFNYGPAQYTVQAWANQNIAASGLNGVDALQYTYDGVPFDDSVIFDLNGKTFTVNAPLTLKQGATYTDSVGTGILTAINGLEIEPFAEVTFSSNVTTTTFTVGEGAWVYSDGIFKATGLTTLNADSSIVDNKDMTFLAVTVKTDPGPEDPEDPNSPIVNREGDVNFARFVGGTVNGEALPEAMLAFNGTLTSDGFTRLRIGRISAPAHRGDMVDDRCHVVPVDPENDPNGEKKVVLDEEGMLEAIDPTNPKYSGDEKAATKLCTTNQKSLPTFVQAWLPWGRDSGYYVAYLEDITIYAGRGNYYLHNDSYNIHIGDFTNWNDAANAVAAIKDANCEFTLGICVPETNILTNFKTPTAAASINFKSEYNDEGGRVPVTLKYTGNALAINANTSFENIHFVKVDASNNPTDPYTVTTFNMAGNDLTIRGQVTFNTPVNFSDAKKTGTLRADYNAHLWTGYTGLDNYIENYAISRLFAGNDENNNNDEISLPPAASYMIIAGSITNVGNVVVDDDQMLIMVDYATGSKDRTGQYAFTFNAPGFTPVTLKDNGRVWITNESGSHFKENEAANLSTYSGKTVKYAALAKATITNTYIGGEGQLAGDAMQLTNVFLEGDAWVEALNDFTVAGTVSVYTDRAVFATAINPKNNTPFLTVNGTVIKQNSAYSIQVAVIDPECEWVFDGPDDHDGHPADPDHPKRFITLYDRDSEPVTTSAPLLVAKTATISDFRPFHQVYWDNTTFQGVDSNLPRYAYEFKYKDEHDQEKTGYHNDASFSSNNRNGYFMTKDVKNTIYVNDGSQATVAIAIVEGDDPAFENDNNGDVLENAANSVIGYYASWTDAVNAVNTLKNKQRYEFIVLRDIGGDTADNKPVTMTFPAAGCIAELTVTSIPVLEEKQPTDGKWYDIYYSNNLTLTSHTRFVDVGLTPVKSASHNKVTVDGKKQNLSGYEGTSLPIGIGAYYLRMDNIEFGSSGSNSFDSASEYELSWNKKSGIGAITGNGKNIVTLNISDTETVINGGVTRIGQLGVMRPIKVTGAVGATKIVVNDKFTVYGNLSATTVDASYNAARFYVHGNVTVPKLSVYYGSIYGTLTSNSSKTDRAAVEVGELYVEGKVTANDVTLRNSTTVNHPGLKADNIVDIKGTLYMKGNTSLQTYANKGAAVTIANISSTGANNAIVYVRKEVKNNTHGTTPLTITQKVTLEGETKYPIYLSEIDTYGTAGMLTIPEGAVNVNTGADNLIATIGNNPTSVFTYPGKTLVKSGKSLFYVNTDDNSIKNSLTVLNVDGNDSDSWLFIDYNSAITQINDFNDPDGEYTVGLLQYASNELYYAQLKDTVLTDKNPVGTFALPAQNKAAKITIKSLAKRSKDGYPVAPVEVYMTGNIKGFGWVVFEDVALHATKSATDTSDGTIADVTIAKKNDKITARLDIKYAESSTVDDQNNESKQAWIKVGSLSKLTATDLNLTNTTLTTTGVASIGNLDLVKSDYNADAQATIAKVTTDSSLTAGLESFITVKQNANLLPMFTINGDVTIDPKDYTPVNPFLYVKTKDKNGKLIVKENAQDGQVVDIMTGKALVLAPNADSSNIRAYDLVGEEGIISYRNTSNYVVNEAEANMLWTVTEVGGGLVSYAKTWNDAITVINNINNQNKSYIIELQKAGIWRADAVVDTESNRSAIESQKLKYTIGSYVDSAYGNADVAPLTMPKATAADTITISAKGNLDATLVYKGVFATTTHVVVDDVKLATTTAEVDPNNSRLKIYKPNGMPSVTVAAKKTLTFNEAAVDGVTLGSITGAGNKQVGDVIFNAYPAKVMGNVTLNSLEINNGSSLATGMEIEAPKVSVTTLTCGNDSKLWIDGGLTTTTTNLEDGAYLGCGMIGTGDFATTNISLAQDATLYSRQNITIAKTADLESDSTITSGGTLKATTVNVDGTGAKLSSNGTTTITDIIGKEDQPNELGIQYVFTDPKVNAAGVTTLTISGSVTNTNVDLTPWVPMYDGTGYGAPMPIDEDATVHDLTEMFNISYADPENGIVSGTVYGNKDTWNKSTGWFNRKLVNMPKAQSACFSVIGRKNEDSAIGGGPTKVYLLKNDSGLFVSTVNPAITVKGYKANNFTGTVTYEGVFTDFNQAITEINRIGSNKANKDGTYPDNAFVEILLDDDLGEVDSPLAAINLPTNVCGLRIDGEEYTIYTTVTTLTLKTPTELSELFIMPVKKSGTDYVPGLYSISGRNLALTLDDFVMGTDPYTPCVSTVNVGTLKLENGTAPFITTGDVNVTTLICDDGATLGIGGSVNATNANLIDTNLVIEDGKGVFKATTLDMSYDSSITMLGSGSFTATTATLENSEVNVKGAVTVTTANLKNAGSIYTKGTFKATDVNVEGRSVITAGSTCSMVNLTSGAGAGYLLIQYPFSAPTLNNKKVPTKPGASMLSITGTVDSNVHMLLDPFIPTYDSESGEYVYGNSKISTADALKILDTANAQGKNKLDPSKRIFQDNTEGTGQYVYFDQSLGNVGKAPSANITVRSDGDEHGLKAYKVGQKLYLSSLEPMITVTGFSNEDYTVETYQSQFFDLSEATAEIDRIRVRGQKDDNNAYVEIELSEDLGTAENPIASIALPSYVTEVTVCGGKKIYTSSASVALKTNTVFEELTIINRKKSNNKLASYDTNGTYSIAGGKFALTLDAFNTGIVNGAKTGSNPDDPDNYTETGLPDPRILECYVQDIACGSLYVDGESGWRTPAGHTPLTAKGKIAVSGKMTNNVMVHAGGALTANELEINKQLIAATVTVPTTVVGANGSLVVPGNITATKLLDVNSMAVSTKGNITAGIIEVDGAVRLNHGTLTCDDLSIGKDMPDVPLDELYSVENGVEKENDMWPGVTAENVTVKNLLTLDNARLAVRGTPGKNDGIISVKNMRVTALGNKMTARESTKGLSQITISGTVTDLKDDGTYAGILGEEQLDGSFVLYPEGQEPVDIELITNDAIGKELKTITKGTLLVNGALVSDAWFKARIKDARVNGTYKQGKGIYAGNVDDMEVRLHTYSTGLVTDAKGNIVDVNGDGIKDDKDAFPVTGPETVSDFATFEDAVAEINNLNRYKTLTGTGKNSKYYDDYDIEIIKTRLQPDEDEFGNPIEINCIDIQNAAGVYQALKMPTKVGNLKIYSSDGHGDNLGPVEVRFLGGFTMSSNLELENGIILVPMVLNNKTASYEKTHAAFNLGTYRLKLVADNNDPYYDALYATTITGGNNSTIEMVTTNGKDLGLYPSGNITVNNIKLLAENDLDTKENEVSKDLQDISGFESKAMIYSGGSINVTNMDLKATGISIASVEAETNLTAKSLDMYSIEYLREDVDHDNDEFDNFQYQNSTFVGYGGTATFTNINRYGDGEARFHKYGVKPVTVNGTVTIYPVNGNDGYLKVFDASVETITVGSTMLTGKNLNPEDFAFISCDNTGFYHFYSSYRVGNNILSGAQLN